MQTYRIPLTLFLTRFSNSSSRKSPSVTREADSRTEGLIAKKMHKVVKSINDAISRSLNSKSLMICSLSSRGAAWSKMENGVKTSLLYFFIIMIMMRLAEDTYSTSNYNDHTFSSSGTEDTCSSCSLDAYADIPAIRVLAAQHLDFWISNPKWFVATYLCQL